MTNRFAETTATILLCALACTVTLGNVRSNWTCATSAAPWSGRLNHRLLQYNDSLWLSGGSDGTAVLTNDVWRSSDGINWQQVTAAAPWAERWAHGQAVYNGLIWHVGGQGSWAQEYTNDVWTSVDGTNWTCVTLGAQWTPRAAHALETNAGVMWAIGGVGEGAIRCNDVWSSSDGTNWICAVVSAPWSARYLFGAASYHGRLWVCGGYDGAERNDVWSSADGSNWVCETANAPWTPRLNTSVVVFNDRMYLVGGCLSGDTVMFNDVWSSADGSNWVCETAAAEWPQRYGGQCAVLNGAIWLVGGKSNDVYMNDVWFSHGGIEITNAPAVVAPPVGSIVLAGTNTELLVGDMWVSNECNGALAVFPAAPSWTAPPVPLVFGENYIHVWGTNDSGGIAHDMVAVTRDGKPCIRVTNDVPAVVANGTANFLLAGTNNTFVEGGVWWSNRTANVAGMATQTFGAWKAQVPLVSAGTTVMNRISIYGTNMWEGQAEDVVTIMVTSPVIRAPFVDVTDVLGEMKLMATGILGSAVTVVGTNNDFVVGTMWISNSADGQCLSFPAMPWWAAPGLTIHPLTNEFFVYGSNILGYVANDSVTVIGMPEPAAAALLGAWYCLRVQRRRLRQV